MCKNPRVSVIIPAYNAEKYIGQCLESVIGQTCRDIEIICVNDGSADRTRDVIQSYMAKDDRITLIDQKNLYAGTARNTGLRICTGEYVVFWDADDFFDKTALMRMADQMDKDRADICIADARQYDDARKVYISKDYYLNKKRLPKHIPYSIQTAPQYIFNISTNVAWNKMFRTSFVKSEHLWFEEIPRANDQYFVVMATAKAQRITIVDKVLMNYRTNTKTSLTSNFSLSPLCTYETLKRIHDALLSESAFSAKAAQSFANKALNSLLYSLKIQTTPESFRQLYNCLIQGGFHELGIEDKGEKYYYSKGEYAKFKELIQSGTMENYLFKQSKKPEGSGQAKGLEMTLAYKVLKKIYCLKIKYFCMDRI